MGAAGVPAGGAVRRVLLREAQNCDLIEAWPGRLTLLAISVPVSVLGVALFVAGTVRRQATAHVREVIEMQRAEARQKKKA
ncbi:hypothetical protein [Streptomyces cyaneofuscatus]|uniref:hypothetical protein n=1 Tax=Streptomyces cyaneofuscatus TaxID=66883 RepID=UPI00364EA80A